MFNNVSRLNFLMLTNRIIFMFEFGHFVTLPGFIRRRFFNWDHEFEQFWRSMIAFLHIFHLQIASLNGGVLWSFV